jgi:hypothetical protein
MYSATMVLMRVRPIVAVLILCGLPGVAEEAKRLLDIHRIYVDSFDEGDAADAIRSKIVAQLAKARRFEVVESADQADAVLNGASQIVKLAKGNQHAPGGERYHAKADVQLIGKDQTILWMDDFSTGAASHFTATSNLAERIVKDLLKATSKDAKTK